MKGARDSSGRLTAGNTIALVVLLAMSAVFLLPFAWSLSASLKPLGKVYEFPPNLMVDDPQFLGGS